MGTIWFCLVAIVLTGYVVLDGFDLGVGILHLWIARDEASRRAAMRCIGPFWNGNEVWLIAAGGTLFFAFPRLYASSFSGFYLPLMIVLWLLIIRGVSLEFRSHLRSGIWAAFWDAGFSLASVLLAIFYGAALGNVVRGVPFDANLRFFEPLWTNFLPRGQTGILDWYTALVGLVSLAALALHGTTWLSYKLDDSLRERARSATLTLWCFVIFLTIAVTVVSFLSFPRLLTNYFVRPWGYVFPVLAIAGLIGTRWFAYRTAELWAFGASCFYLMGMLASVAFSLYPSLLPSSMNPAVGLTIANAKAADHGLKIGIVWWFLGMALASGYTIFTYRSFAGKIKPDQTNANETY